jgi:hypothetical protein
MMRRLLLALLAFAVATLAGCSAFNPYATVARPSEAGQPAGARVGICYNTLTSSLAALQKAAQQECAAGTTAEPVDTDWHMQVCPLLLPARATFVCVAKK